MTAPRIKAAPVGVLDLRQLRCRLPAEAFSSCPRKLLRLAFHIAVVATGYGIINASSHAGIWLFVSLIIGHSLACIAFLAHEISHGSIIRSRALRYPIEFLAWGLNFIAPTLWYRVHNLTHHSNAGSASDPDRPFLVQEDNLLTRCYSYLFYPTRRSIRWNPLVGLHFVPYILRNTLAAFYPPNRKPCLVPAKAAFTFRERVFIALELSFIALLQVTVFYAVGGSVARYMVASPLSVLVSSCVVMGYVFTNHFLNQVHDHPDALSSTTSVIVPPILDYLHQHFSYHTEHHLFPGMNSDFYPSLSLVLRQDYDRRYRRIAITEAWRRLWENSHFAEAPNDRGRS